MEQKQQADKLEKEQADNLVAQLVAIVEKAIRANLPLDLLFQHITPAYVQNTLSYNVNVIGDESQDEDQLNNFLKEKVIDALAQAEALTIESQLDITESYINVFVNEPDVQQLVDIVEAAVVGALPYQLDLKKVLPQREGGKLTYVIHIEGDTEGSSLESEFRTQIIAALTEAEASKIEALLNITETYIQVSLTGDQSTEKGTTLY